MPLLVTTLKTALASLVLAVVAWQVWEILDRLLGDGFAGDAVSLAAALTLGGIAYVASCRLLRVGELDEVLAVFRRTA